MGVYEITQLYIGLATIVAALTITQYSRKKAGTMDAEARRAFRPLFVVVIALVVYAMGALTTYYEEVTGQIFLLDTYYSYYVGAAVEVILLGIAGAMILNSRRVYSVPIGTTFATVFLFYLALTNPQTADFLLLVAILLPAIILLFIGGIFVWIARNTMRSTSAALAFALITQIVGLPALYFESSYLLVGPSAMIALFIVLMGPAMVIFSFLRPDQKVSFELVGYGASFAAPVLIFVSIQAEGLVTDMTVMPIALLGAVAVLLSLGTTSYLYGRWVEGRQLPTILMMLAFLLFAIGHITGMLGNLGMFPNPDAIYIEFILTGFALTFLAMGAIYAAGWRSTALIPMIAFLPISLLIAQAYPADIGTTFLNLLYITVPTIGIMLLPSIVFLGVWKRMRADGVPGSLRPLGVAIAIILFFIIRLPPMVLELGGLDYSYGLVVVSYLLFWSALTGRLDRVAGTI